MIEGFLFCLGVMLALVALPFIVALIPFLLCLAAVVVVVGGIVFLWLIDPGAVEGLLAIVLSLAILCGACWCTGEVWDQWMNRGKP